MFIQIRRGSPSPFPSVEEEDMTFADGDEDAYINLAPRSKKSTLAQEDHDGITKSR